jgi:hypothetical protein
VTTPDPASNDTGDPTSDTAVEGSRLPVPTTARVAHPAPTDPTVLARRLTRLGIGALLASTDAARNAVGAQAPPERLTDVGLGALALAREASLAAGRAAAGAARDAAAAAEPLVRQVGSLPGVAPVVDAGRASLSSTLDALADAGRVERQLASTEGAVVVQRTMEAVAASELLPDAAEALAHGTLPDAIGDLLPAIVDRLATDPELLVPVVTGVLAKLADNPAMVEPVVDAIMTSMANDPDKLLVLVNRLLDPVVADAIPISLQQLSDDPDAIRALIWDQSGGLANQMANSVRARTVSADDAIDRVTAMLWRRRTVHDQDAGDDPAPPGHTGSAP